MIFLLLVTGCEILSQDCNLMYAPSSFTASFEVASEGVWEWTVTAEGMDVACSVTLPEGTDAACEGTTSTPTVEIVADGWVIGSTTFEGGQDEVHVTLSHDGALVVDETLTPEWSMDEPNGEGCGERFQSEQTFTVE